MTAYEIATHLMDGVDYDGMVLHEFDEDTNTFYIQDTDGNRFSVCVRKED